VLAPYTQGMADDSVLDEIQDNTKEAGQRLRASLNLMRSQDMTSSEDYRELVTRLSTALAMTESAYLEARRRREM
jgi:chromosome condensin MukBEF complex kleisin-like MukF subunit